MTDKSLCIRVFVIRRVHCSIFNIQAVTVSVPDDELNAAEDVTDVSMECVADRTNQEAEETDVAATGQESMYNCIELYAYMCR